MKQSARISILTVTAVVAAATFGIVWVTRPSVDNSLIQKAQARQLQPLVEVQQPAAQPEQATAPAATESAIDEDALYEEFKQRLLADDDVTKHYADAAKSEAPAPAAAADIDLSEAEKAVDEKIKTDHDIQTEEYKAYIDQYVADHKAEFVQLVYDDVIAHKDEYLAILADELRPVARSYAEDLYVMYRDSIVQDIAPDILAMFDARLKAWQEEVNKALALQKEQEAAATAPETPVAVETPQVVQQAEEERNALKPITAPEIVEWEKPVPMTESTYSEKRNAGRDTAITEVLQRIEEGSAQQ